MTGRVLAGNKSGVRIPDPEYGRLWELANPQIAPVKGYGFAYVEVTAETESPLHFHSRTEELYYVVAGAGEVTLGDTKTEVKPGDTVIIPIGVHHKIRGGTQGVSFMCVTCPPYDPEDDEDV